MRAIYRQVDIPCYVVEDDGDGVILEPIDGTIDQRFSVPYSNPSLELDPTDGDRENAVYHYEK